MRTLGRVAVVILAIAALPAVAQTPPREFAKGPAQWLFTPEEQKAWRNVKTDDEAIDFIDLFWARRDPTPGTPRNENRLEFEARVRFADANFAEPGLRGALTERGRVLVVLGFPADWKNQNRSNSREMAAGTAPIDAYDPTGGRTMAEKDTWNYSHEQAVKFGLPKIEVVWIHDRVGGLVRRDPLRMDFTMALPAAIRSYIASPDLATVPDWATSRVKRDVVVATETVTETTTTVVTKKTVVDAPKPVALPSGAGMLTLVRDAAALQPQSGSDPFAIDSVARFKRSQDLGWAARYCAGALLADAPPVTVRVKLAGADGTVTSDPEQFIPDSIKASPGCYLVRGSVPLADVEPGPHQLTITIAAGERSYNLTRELTIE